MGDQFCDRKNCPDAIYPWPFWREPIGRAQKNPPTPPFLFFCSIRPIGLRSAQIRSLCKLSQLVPKPSSVAPVWTAVFTPGATVMEMIGGSASRPIVCRESTGPITSERPFALPAIVASACAIFAGASSGPSLLPIATQIAMLQLPGLFPLEAMISQSFIWLKRELSLSKVGPQPLPGTSISLLRTILAVTTTCSSGRLPKEPEVLLLRILAARGIRKPNRRRPQLRSRPTTRTM